MICSERDIREALAAQHLVIQPAPAPDMFATSSVDLRLGNHLTKFPPPIAGVDVVVQVDSADAEAVVSRYGQPEYIASGQYLDLRPGEFALAFTLERVEFPLYLAARVEGKSSLARYGLSVHQSAPTIHAGFNGNIRLEIANVGPLVCRLIPGISICQLVIEELKTPAANQLRSSFRNQNSS